MMFSQLAELSKMASKNRAIHQHHFYQGLPSEIMNNPKWKKHLKEERGRGYWFWKPALINYLLKKKKIVDGDLVVWADADIGYLDKSYITGEGTPERYDQLLQDPPWDVFVKNQQTCEFDWTKADLFHKFGVKWDDRQYGPTAQAHAQFAIFNINDKTRQFLQYWEDIMADLQVVDDTDSVRVRELGFKRENRHDQSALSLLAKANLAVEQGHSAESTYHMCCSQKGLACMDESVKDIRPILNPTYGIPGLVAKIGSFYAEPDDGSFDSQPGNSPVNMALPKSPVSNATWKSNPMTKFAHRNAMTRFVFAEHPAPKRTICVWDECVDMDALPTDGHVTGVDNTNETFDVHDWEGADTLPTDGRVTGVDDTNETFNLHDWADDFA